MIRFISRVVESPLPTLQSTVHTAHALYCTFLQSPSYGGVFTTGSVLMVIGRGWTINMRGLAASRTLHDDLIQTVVNASSGDPLRILSSIIAYICQVFESAVAFAGFFISTPTGRLLNRFSRDLNQVDAMLPMQFDQIFSMFTMLVGALITTAVISPLYVAFLFPVALAYYKAYV